MTFFSPPAPKGFRYPWYGILFSGVCFSVAMYFMYAFAAEMYGTNFFGKISEFLWVMVPIQGIVQVGMRTNSFNPEATPKARTVRDWIRLWMVSSLVVCTVGLICRFLTGRFDPRTLAEFQFAIPTAICLAAYVQGMADRHALALAERGRA